MLRILLVASAFLFTISFTSAQSRTDQRTVTTRIADLLALMPARNQEELSRSMQMMSDINEAGLLELISKLDVGASTGNTQAEYAIAGFSSFVTQPGNETKRQIAVKSYCSALEKLTDKWNREFIIRQLQAAGKDDAVPCLQKYMNDELLSDAAIRALAQINSTAAKKVLLTSLKNAGGARRLSLVEALGYSRYTPAASSILSFAKTGDKDLKKVSLYALSRMAAPAAGELLASAAKEANYSFDQTNATSYYLQYIEQLLANGNVTQADKLARQLLEQTKDGKQLHTRTAALKLVVDANKEKSLPVLFRALQDPDMKYRAAALGFSSKFRNPSVNKQWLQVMNGLNADAKAQVIYMLGNTADKTLLPSLKSALREKDEQVRIAAITAVGKIGQEAALPDLLEVMKSGNTAEVLAVKNSILTMKGANVTNSIISSVESMPASSRVALMEVLAARADDRANRVIVKQLSSTDTSVRSAAVMALPNVVKQENLSELFPLLNTAGSKDQLNAIQTSIINASAGITDTVQRSKIIIDQLRNMNGKEYLLFEVLGAVGGTDAINQLQTNFEKGNDVTKLAAISALSKANGQQAANTLLTIARKPENGAYQQSALNGYIQMISRSSFAADQKLLMLREAMDLAQTDGQKRNIIREAGKCNTFLALVFAGNYLDSVRLQQEAGTAVMNIALANKQFNGNIVRRLLSRTAELLRGGDSEYLKVAIQKHLSEMPAGEGFVPLFNGRDLTGWKGLVADPVKRSKMSADTLSAAQAKADREMKEGWVVKDGLLVFTGHGNNLATQKQYGDFEMLVDWKITKEGDAGIYLRGSPQVQIWDPARVKDGAQVGSGGLYNNQKNPSKPLLVADNPVGEWNTFHIIMKGEKVTVYLNGQLVTDNVPLENYWDRSIPIYPKEQIELQAHGTYVAYRNVYIKELGEATAFQLSDEEKKQGFTVLFDGKNLDQWTGNKTNYVVDNGDILVTTAGGGTGNLFTKDEYSDFILRFEFQLTPGANNGLGIRAPLEGDAAYSGMELQILDNTADVYKDLKPYQFHGSVYGIIPAKKGFLKPVGEWNYQEVIAKGSKIKVILNNEVILDGDLEEAVKNGAPDHREHPGLKNKKGHIGFLGHGSTLRLRNIRIKDLSKP